MINIFYNKNNLKDTMVISIKNMKPTEVETNKDFSILKNNGEIVGINIFALPFLSALNPIKTLKTEPKRRAIAITIAKGVKKLSPVFEIWQVLST